MRSENNIIIGIDTSCYTTSIAAISLDKDVIFNEKIMLQVKEHSRGLRQSEAVFQHVKNVGDIGEKIKSIINKYNVLAICVSKKPRPVDNSYMPVFMVSYNLGKLLSSILNCPLYETTHQENHIEASLFNNNICRKNKFLSIHMSGGTMEILLVSKSIDGYKIDIVGGSKDISFGQLIDRVGVKMGYSFPAGKYIDVNALKCEVNIENGVKTSVKNGYMNISGIENQIDKFLNDCSKEYVSKLVLDSVVRSIYKAVLYLAQENDIDEVVFAGGVAASKYISRELTLRLKRKNIKAYFSEPQYSTDNAVGCAIIGLKEYLNKF